MGGLSGRVAAAAVAGLLWSALAVADVSAPRLSDRALLPAWLRSLQADIVISAESVEWQGQVLQDVELPLAVHDGALRVSAARARLAGGELALELSHDAAGELALQLRASDLVLGELPAVRPFVSGVPIDLLASLTARGDSLRALAASTSGRLQIRNTGPGIVRHGFEEMGDNLVYHFISAFEVFRRAGSDAHLECVAMDLPFHAGLAVAAQSMELRTRRLHVRGGGRVDLRDETLDLVFKPETRRTIKLQSLKAVERVRVHGALRAPEVTLDSAHLVGRAARFGLDVANLGGGAVFKRLLGRKPAAGLCSGALAAPLKTP